MDDDLNSFVTNNAKDADFRMSFNDRSMMMTRSSADVPSTEFELFNTSTQSADDISHIWNDSMFLSSSTAAYDPYAADQFNRNTPVLQQLSTFNEHFSESVSSDHILTDLDQQVNDYKSPVKSEKVDSIENNDKNADLDEVEVEDEDENDESKLNSIQTLPLNEGSEESNDLVKGKRQASGKRKTKVKANQKEEEEDKLLEESSNEMLTKKSKRKPTKKMEKKESIKKVPKEKKQKKKEKDEEEEEEEEEEELKELVRVISKSKSEKKPIKSESETANTEEEPAALNSIVFPPIKTKNLEITEALNKSGYKPFNRNQIPLIIRNYLTSHQWKKSAKMIMILTQDSRLYGDILLKTGLLVFDKKLHHRTDQRKNIMSELEQFNRLIQSISGVSRIEATFEQLYLCFKYGSFEYIDNVISNPIKYIKKHHSTEKKKVAGNNFKGFLEFYKYYRHIAFLADRNRIEPDSDDYCSPMSHITIIMGLRDITLGQMYPSDYYFLCLINLLIYYKKIEDAQDCLQAYVQKHPLNMNALLYLHKFNQLYMESREVNEQCIKNIISLDPGNAKILDWIGDLTDSLEQVRVLFNFVDFVHNKENHKAWRTLYSLLKDLWSDESKKEVIEQIYQKYFASYWSVYHFVIEPPSNSQPKTLSKHSKCLYYKAKICLLLKATDLNHFPMQVECCLKQRNDKLYEKLNVQMDNERKVLEDARVMEIRLNEPNADAVDSIVEAGKTDQVLNEFDCNSDLINVVEQIDTIESIDRIESNSAFDDVERNV